MTDQYHQLQGQGPLLKPDRDKTNAPAVKRVCSSCGFKDTSILPPIACPNCHFEQDSVVAPKLNLMNRRERRVRDAQNKKQQRKTQKELAKLPKPVAG